MRVLEVICEGGLSLSGTQLIDNANHVPPASRLLIRDATVDDTAILARVHIDSWRTTYHGILPDDVLDGLSYESHVPEWVSIISDRKPNEFVTVAEWDGAVVGFANGGPERFDDPSFEGEL